MQEKNMKAEEIQSIASKAGIDLPEKLVQKFINHSNSSGEPNKWKNKRASLLTKTAE